MDWIGFFSAIVVLSVVSRKNLLLALFLGAITLGLFTLSPFQIGIEILKTVKDPSIILLAIAVGIIPLIGEVMKEDGQIDGVIDNFRVGKKAFLALTPAFLGMLPIPGGTLLSAPLIERAGPGSDNRTKLVINVWFRHLFLLIYPLSPTLIASAKIAGHTVYDIIPWFIPQFLLASLIGYIFFLHRVQGRIDYRSSFSIKGLLIPLSVILSAPVIDLFLRRLFIFSVSEIATVIAVSVSLLLSILFSSKKQKIREIIKRAKPWSFGGIIIAMFTFLNIFISSGTAQNVVELSLSGPLLYVVIGFVLGFITGGIQLPASLILPIYIVNYGSISPLVFSLTYFSIFWGYVVSPVHPCVVVTLEYFKVQIKDFYLRIAIPASIIFFALFISSFFLI